MGSMDGLYVASSLPPRKQDFHRIHSTYDCHPPAPPSSLSHNRAAPRRCNEARLSALQAFADSSASSNAIIGRPQQLMEGAVVYRNCRPSIFSLPSSLASENANSPLKESVNDGNCGNVAKSASSASDSSVNSYGSASTYSVSDTTNTTTTTTSGESVGSGKFNYSNSQCLSTCAITAPIRNAKLRMRHSLGKEGTENGVVELLKTDDIQKRLTH